MFKIPTYTYYRNKRHLLVLRFLIFHLTINKLKPEIVFKMLFYLNIVNILTTL